jgi:hypothetical protein
MGWIGYFLIVVVGLAFFIWYLKYANAYNNRILKIGVVAAQTFVMTGQHDALVAVKMVKARMARALGNQLLIFIRQIPTKDTTVEREENNKQRLDRVLNELSENNMNGLSASKLKEELISIDSKWLPSIVNCDLELADKAAIETMVESIGKQKGGEVM